MAEYVDGINPEILKWARERSGYSLEAAAKTLSKDISFINECESGNLALTYAQLETLADKYKRPVAIFFFPEPPEEENIAENLALRSSDVDQLEPRIHILLRQAYARQLSLMELSLGKNPSENQIFRDFHAQLNDSPLELAKQTRVYLNISVDQQTNWKNSTEALENWRECIQEKGIFIFKDAFKDNSVDGFCLVHDVFPVIYLNNSRPAVRQIFTLFHELAHLLLGKNGITRDINPTGEKIETFCNQFAAEFLVPSDDLESHLKFPDYDDDTVEKLASIYKVSRPVILLKLVNKGILTNEIYLQKIKGWTALYESHREQRTGDESPGGGSYYNTQTAYLGPRYMEFAFSKFYQGQCTIEQLSEHLNVKVKNLSGLEDCLLRKAVRK
jgi:Zn-dependent peptidase ImmA (M78 family)